jgi:septal ring factor EnvC (AmiA/AmiB activator)
VGLLTHHLQSMWSRLAKAGETAVRIAAIATKSSILMGLLWDSFGSNVCITPAAQNGIATIWPISVALLHLPHMAAAKETTLNEVGEMLAHVVEHTATKEDVAKLDTGIDDLRTEMIDQLEHADKQFRATDDRLRDMAAEITAIHRRVERLEEQGASNAGAKEIDQLLTRVAEIEKHLGIDKKIAA